MCVLGPSLCRGGEGVVGEVQPADTEVCVFPNEIYRAPDVHGYEDVCLRFRGVRPAPCQSHGGVLFYCRSPPSSTLHHHSEVAPLT